MTPVVKRTISVPADVFAAVQAEVTDRESLSTLFSEGARLLLRQRAGRRAIAAYECEHGRLPHDPTVPCDCWAMEITKDMTNPIGGTTNGISNDNHKARVARFAAQGLQAKQGSEQGHREASPAAPVPA